VPSPQAQLKVVFYLPFFFPDQNDSRWGTKDFSSRRQLRESVKVEIDGVERLSKPLEYSFAERPPLYLGANPIGGSVVSDFFTGTLVQSSQSF
jgi:hypothetical protein